MHFKNARNASVYAVFRAFFTQSLAKLRIFIRCCQMLRNAKYTFNLLWRVGYGIEDTNLYERQNTRCFGF